jgi:hypothetical protein
MVSPYLLLITFLGPWDIDRVHWPAQYDNSGLNLLLKDDFCGRPLAAVGLGLV